MYTVAVFVITEIIEIKGMYWRPHAHVCTINSGHKKQLTYNAFLNFAKFLLYYSAQFGMVASRVSVSGICFYIGTTIIPTCIYGDF